MLGVKRLGKAFVLLKEKRCDVSQGAIMKKFLLLSIFLSLALVGCGEGDPYDSTVQADDGKSRHKLAVPETAFVKAKDGTLYSIDCLKENGAEIAAGVKGAGRECAADQLNETQARGIYGRYGREAYFYYVNPLNYYGGTTTQSNHFCNATFGQVWGGCYAWLGYSPSYYQTSYWYPECAQCVTTSQSTPQPNSIYPTTTGCPSYCRYVQNWNSQPFYQDWNQANGFSLYY